MSIDSHIQQIKDCGVIAILRGQFSIDDVLQIADCLITNGITVLEITMNSPAALGALPELQKRFGDSALIGAGTVRNLTDWEQAHQQGAVFTVAPNFDADIAKHSIEQDRLYLPGVATPGEAMIAKRAGCGVQKLFPIQAMGGTSYLKAIRGPLDDIDFIPVGGVSVDDLNDYFKFGAMAVGMGGSLVPSQDWSLSTIA